MRYQVKDPQGNIHVIEGPEGAKPEDVIAQAQKLIPQQPKQEQPANPNAPTMGNVFPKMLGTVASDLSGTMLKDVGQNVMGGLGTLKAGLYDIPKAVGSLPNELAQGLTGNMPETQLGSLTKGSAQGLVEGAKEAVMHPVDTLIKHPFSAATMLTGTGAPEAAASKVPTTGFFRKALNLFKKSASPEELGEAVGGVQDMVSTAKNKFGTMLDEAKSKAGLPTTVEEKVGSISKYKNAYNLDVDQPLKMVEQPIGASKSFEGPSKFDETAPKVEPYKIGTHSSQHDLLTEIERFTKSSSKIDEGDKIKAASYLQDQINNHVDWNKQGDSIQGLLKQQYKDLGRLITTSSEGLQGAKSKMAEVYKSLDEIENKLKDPGQAEAFLKRIANNPTGKNADYLTKLRKLEKLTGTESVDDLFKMFADQKRLDLSHPIRDTVKAGLESVGANLHKVPKPVGAAGFSIGIRNNNREALQSIRDRLNAK